MVRTVRVNFKSGVLPRPRQVVPKLRTKKEERSAAKIPQKFEEGMAPKGSSPNPPPRLPKTAQQKIDLSAKVPKQRSPRSEQDAWKQHIAEVRRTYLESTLKAYEQHEQKHQQFREAREAKNEKEVASRLSTVTESLATAFTTPTIESTLTNEFVIKRTPEEAKELQLKREYNRKLTEKRVAEAQADDLVQLYQQASKFITTEQQLESRIADLFKPARTIPPVGPNDTQTPSWYRYLRTNGHMAQNNDASQRTREEELKSAMEGVVRVPVSGNTVRELPGLKKIRD